MTTLNEMDAKRSRMHTAQEAGKAEEKQARLEKIAKFSRAFYPGTIDGLAKRLWELKLELSNLEKERTNLRQILTEHMVLTGEVIEVEGQPTLRLDWIAEYDSYLGKMAPKYRPVFDPLPRTRR